MISVMNPLFIVLVLALAVQTILFGRLLRQRDSSVSVIEIEYVIGFPGDEYLTVIEKNDRMVFIPVIEESLVYFMPEDLIDVEGYMNN